MTGLTLYPKRRLRKLMRQGEYEQAIEYGRSLESKFSDDADYNFIMGSLFYILEDAAQAIKYFDAALKIDGSDIESWMLKGNVHLFLGEKKEVLECCNRVLDIRPEHAGAEELLERLRDA